MKNKLKYLITAILAISVFSCELDGVSTKASNSSFRNDKADIIAESENLTAALNFEVTNVSNLGEVQVDDTWYRTMTVTFAGGQLDLDSDNLAKIKVYNLPTAGTTADNLYWSSTTPTLELALYTIDTLNAGTVITLYYKDSAISSSVEVVIENTITADNGAKKLNQDGDAFIGDAEEEEIEDNFFQVRTVAATNTTATTPLGAGEHRIAPTTLNNFSFTTDGAYTQATGVFTFTHDVGTVLGRASFTKESLLSSLVVQTFNYSTMSWDDAPHTLTAYDSATQTATATLTTAPGNGSYIRFSYDENSVAMATAGEGFIRKLNNAAFTARTWKYRTVDTSVAPSEYYTPSAALAATAVTENGSRSVKLVFTTSAADDYVNASTLTADSVRFFLAVDGATKTKQLTFDAANIKKFATNSYEFILDDQEFAFTNGTSNILVEIVPTVTCDDTTDTVATDDTIFGDPTAPFNMVTATAAL